MRTRTIVDNWSSRKRYNYAESKKWKCEACKSKIKINVYKDKSIGVFEVDHIKALKFGGKDHETNLQLLCPNCHRSKSQREAVVNHPYCIICKCTYSKFFTHKCPL